MIKLNNTPVRTCRNYGINNIEFDEKIPSKPKKFEGLKISQDTEKDEVLINANLDNFDRT